jgi:hypothetical protein
MQICPDLARLTRQWKDQEFGTSAAAPSGVEGEIEGDMDDGAAAPLSSQGATPLLALYQCACKKISPGGMLYMHLLFINQHMNPRLRASQFQHQSML